MTIIIRLLTFYLSYLLIQYKLDFLLIFYKLLDVTNWNVIIFIKESLKYLLSDRANSKVVYHVVPAVLKSCQSSHLRVVLCYAGLMGQLHFHCVVHGGNETS